jgi:hypothetical protein
MAEVDYRDQLEDVVNAVEDLAAAFKSAKPAPMPKMPAPVVRVDSPAPIVPTPQVTVEPSIIVQHDRCAFTATVIDRDRHGKVKVMKFEPA